MLLKVTLALIAFNSHVDDDDDETKKSGSAAGYDRKSLKKSKKSGRFKTAAHHAKFEVEWPQFHVYRGADRVPSEYDELTVAEFCYGYLKIAKNDKYMIKHLEQLTHLATLYKWEDVRNCHGFILTEMEQGRLKWGDNFQALFEAYAKITRINLEVPDRRSDVMKIKSGTKSSVQNKQGQIVCFKFQRGNCSERNSHVSSAGYLLHNCEHCFKMTGNLYNHPAFECRRKNSQYYNNGYNGRQEGNESGGH